MTGIFIQSPKIIEKGALKYFNISFLVSKHDLVKENKSPKFFIDLGESENCS